MSKSSTAPAAGQRTPKEYREFEFRGTYTPPHVFQAIRDGVVSSADHLILAVVSALTPPDRPGCYASNEYLGRMVRAHPKSIPRMIARLTGAGLLVRRTVDGVRYLTVTWGEGGNPDVTPRGNPTVTQREEEERTKQSDVCGQTSRGDDAVFFDNMPGKDKSRTVTPEPGDMDAADRLYHALRDRGVGNGRRYSQRNWARQIAMIRLQTSPERVRDVLDWYLDHIQDQFTPRAYSGEGFRVRFDKIAAAMDRDRKRRPVCVCTPAAERIAARLARKVWPAGSGALLPAVVQQSIDAATAFAGRLNTRAGHTDQLGRFAGRLIAGRMPPPEHLVEQYLAEVRTRLVRWKGWSGSLGDWTFAPDRPEVAALGRGWARAMTGDPGAWDRLLAETGA